MHKISKYGTLSAHIQRFVDKSCAAFMLNRPLHESDGQCAWISYTQILKQIQLYRMGKNGEHKDFLSHGVFVYKYQLVPDTNQVSLAAPLSQ